MPDHRFEHREENQRQRGEEREKNALEFATAEEAIRHDLEETIPPPEIAERLNQSLANEPRKETSFWARITGRK